MKKIAPDIEDRHLLLKMALRSKCLTTEVEKIRNDALVREDGDPEKMLYLLTYDHTIFMEEMKHGAIGIPFSGIPKAFKWARRKILFTFRFNFTTPCERYNEMYHWTNENAIGRWEEWWVKPEREFIIAFQDKRDAMRFKLIF